MQQADLRRYKRLLLEKQHGLFLVRSDAAPQVPGVGISEGDVIDQANAGAEAVLQNRLHQTDGRLWRAIEDALARMRHGTYGVCDLCKRPISKVRLEAVPWTRHCRKCKEREHPGGIESAAANHPKTH